jgi:hypothetical protein
LSEDEWDQFETEFILTPNRPWISIPNRFLVYVRAFGAYISPWIMHGGLPGTLEQQYNNNLMLIMHDTVYHAGDYPIWEYYKHSTIHLCLTFYEEIPEDAEIVFLAKLNAPVMDPPYTHTVQLFVGTNKVDEESWQGGLKNIGYVLDRPINPNYINIFIRPTTHLGIYFVKATAIIL